MKWMLCSEVWAAGCLRIAVSWLYVCFHTHLIFLSGCCELRCLLAAVVCDVENVTLVVRSPPADLQASTPGINLRKHWQILAWSHTCRDSFCGFLPDTDTMKIWINSINDILVADLKPGWLSRMRMFALMATHALTQLSAWLSSMCGEDR